MRSYALSLTVVVDSPGETRPSLEGKPANAIEITTMKTMMLRVVTEEIVLTKLIIVVNFSIGN